MNKFVRYLALTVLFPVSVYAVGNNWIKGNKGGNLIPRRTSITAVETAAEAAGTAGEKDGIRIDANYTGVGVNVLWSALRVETQYDISGATAAVTEHGGAGFFETNGARNNQYFYFGMEDSVKSFVGALSPANAAAISHISHVKMFNDLNITQNYAAIAWNPRMDFFTTAYETTSYSTHTYGYFIRPEAYYTGNPKTLFGWYNPTDKNIQNVNAGNVFKISVSSAVDYGATLDLSQACGGRIILTSTGAITLSATQFANTPSSVVPSSSSFAGWFNQDCEVKVVNGNLIGGRTITLVDTSDLIPIGATLDVGALGGETEVWSFPTAGAWIQSKAPTK